EPTRAEKPRGATTRVRRSWIDDASDRRRELMAASIDRGGSEQDTTRDSVEQRQHRPSVDGPDTDGQGRGLTANATSGRRQDRRGKEVPGFNDRGRVREVFL